MLDMMPISIICNLCSTLYEDQDFTFDGLTPGHDYQAFILTVADSGRRSDPIYGTFRTCMFNYSINLVNSVKFFYFKY